VIRRSWEGGTSLPLNREKAGDLVKSRNLSPPNNFGGRSTGERGCTTARGDRTRGAIAGSPMPGRTKIRVDEGKEKRMV